MTTTEVANLERFRVPFDVSLSLIVQRFLKGKVPTGVPLETMESAWVFEYVETVMELMEQGKHAPRGVPTVYWDYDDWVV